MRRGLLGPERVNSLHHALLQPEIPTLRPVCPGVAPQWAGSVSARHSQVWCLRSSQWLSSRVSCMMPGHALRLCCQGPPIGEAAVAPTTHELNHLNKQDFNFEATLCARPCVSVGQSLLSKCQWSRFHCDNHWQRCGTGSLWAHPVSSWSLLPRQQRLPSALWRGYIQSVYGFHEAVGLCCVSRWHIQRPDRASLMRAMHRRHLQPQHGILCSMCCLSCGHVCRLPRASIVQARMRVQC